MVNILQPIPNTWPSTLYSIAEAATELAKPVMGTRLPAPADFGIKIQACKQDTDQYQDQGTPGGSRFPVQSQAVCVMQDQLSKHADEAACEEGFQHI